MENSEHEIARLTAQIERLKAALRPFAECGVASDKDDRTEIISYAWLPSHQVTVGDLRRAEVEFYR